MGGRERKEGQIFAFYFKGTIRKSGHSSWDDITEIHSGGGQTDLTYYNPGSLKGTQSFKILLRLSWY